MTKICTNCGKTKLGNESTTLQTFSTNVTIRLPKLFFSEPDIVGDLYMAKALTVTTYEGNSIKVMVKWSRKHHMCDPLTHFCSSLIASDYTARIVSAFLDTVVTDWVIKVIKPILLESRKMKISAEPFIKNVKALGTLEEGLREISDVMNAISHYSYIFSKGSYVIKDFKGSIDETDKIITLISPSILSNIEGDYGCEDLGSIRRYFFDDHVCNKFCDGMKLPRLRDGKNDDSDDDDDDYGRILFTPLNLHEKI